MIPVVHTKRLTLRDYEMSDFEPFAQFWVSDRTEFVGGKLARKAAWTAFTSHRGQWDIRGFGLWMVAEKASGAPVGWAGFYYPEYWSEVELGWVLFREFEGQGYAVEAAEAACTYGAVNFGINQPVSYIVDGNQRSIRLAEKLGAMRETTFTNDGIKVHAYRHPGPEAAQ